jgi:flavin-dependent dehydrogenase
VDAPNDVVIVGGGLAGLSLAIQLKDERPQTSVVVLERGKHPFPDAAFKVGESTVEIGGQYLCRVLGENYLETAHIRKAGPRFFFPAGDNRDIAARVEYGTSTFLPIHSYQVDRGRLENQLWAEAQTRGIELHAECKVEEIELGADGHRVGFTEAGADQPTEVRGRWIVDASGRTGLLKRQLGLGAASTHDPNACWFRIDETIDISDWSEDSEWKSKLPPGLRGRATNHLMGAGYWVWLIPLSSGSTSVGIVAHPAFHPFNQINTFERALEWLRRHEPLCAAKVEEKRDKLQDFNVVKHYAYGCQRLFSAERWALTGEAGVFIDPFLSPGTDFIGISNSLVTTMIARDLRGEDISQYVEWANAFYLGLYQLLLQWFSALYPLMGNHQVMVLWVGWYFLLYMSLPVTLFWYRRLWNMEFMMSIQDEMRRFQELSLRGATLLSDFGQRFQQPWSNHFADIMKLEHIIELQRELVANRDATLSDDEVRQAIRRNLGLIEATLVDYFERITSLLGIHPGRSDLNPYALSLDPSRWEADGLFTGSKSYKSETVSGNIGAVWYVG